MKKVFQLYLLPAIVSALTGGIFASCNSDDTWGSEPVDLSGTAVTGFSLKNNIQVLNNLDSVYFSIDLVNCRIFNATPLPCDTKTDALAVSIASNSCSQAKLLFKDNDGNDAVVDYLTSPDDKVNFANGPVTLRIVSLDGNNTRDYNITVNVAKSVTDSLYWDRLDSGSLYGITGMNRSRTVKVNGNALTLTSSRSGRLAITTFIPAAQAGGGNWQSAIVEPQFSVNGGSSATPSINVESFTSTSDGSLYLIDNNGNLYRSTDLGNTFTKVDSNWLSLTTAYKNGVLGVKENAGARSFAAYPSTLWPSAGASLPTGFPVKGASQGVEFTTKWAAQPQVVIAGGTTAAGLYSSSTWAFDGNKWAEISKTLPAASGYSMTRYTIAETDTVSWRTKERDILIAFGGNGLKPVKEVWVSKDMGVNWQRGTSLLQLPDYIPFTTGGSLLVFEKTLEAGNATPLAIKPITSWDCPYLYLFGGYGEDGSLLPTYWSGVVNYLTNKPLQ